MTIESIEQIANNIDQLTLSDQLWLMERLAHRIRQRTMYPPSIEEQALIDMANDESIQQELQHIATEFAQADFDGLDDQQ